MYKKDLALNNLQWLICHRIKPNQLSGVSNCSALFSGGNLQDKTTISFPFPF